MKITEMYTGEYYNIARELAGGVKYLANGEKNPAYNPKWGLKAKNAYYQAKSLESQKKTFIQTSTTEKPVEFMATGILGGKAQYGYKALSKQIDLYLREVGTRGETTARAIKEKAIDLSRLQPFLKKYENFAFSRDKDGNLIHNPNYYASLYMQGQISAEEFYKHIDEWKTTVAYMANAGNTKTGSP